ncbi:ras guanine nucleotide exchange factor domain-containing protein [Thamnidium elegans]|nr:ras guanine nucleotide exchange factor domain-containing protein [Thamnidium elegans]
MEDPQSSLAIASRHFDNGQIKDAYTTFLSTAQMTMQSLFDVKFVHCSIVTKPQNATALLSILHTCVDHIEKIIEYHSPTSLATKIAPPLPPKPTHVSKPVLPPKPTSKLPPIPTASVTAPLLKRSVSNKVTPYTSQQHTRSNSSLLVDLSSQRLEYNNEPTEIADGEIDPTHLVPAQTSNSDSLTPTENIKTNHIPLIPVPPLLTTHRVLQAKLDELESSLKDYRTRKQQLSRGEQQQFNYQMTENEINEAISKYTPFVAEAKHTLNRVRTLYMSAATIPSILHFSPGLVAYQITRIESAIFLAIPSHALLSHAPKSPHPRVVASTDFFNYITRLIEHSILLPQEASVRAQHINHWIKIATKCHDLNNYQTLKAIVSALGTPPVQRLKRTWAYIPKKSLSRFETMTELMSEHNNYGKYREHMGIVSTSVLNGKSVNLIQSEHYKRPTVPFLGTFIHDMTYLLAAVGQQQQKNTAAPPNIFAIPTRTSSRQYQGCTQPQHQDARISKLLDILVKFQQTPTYDRKPNATNSKMIQKSQNQVRPSFSQAIHRSKSSFGRLGGAIGFGNSSTTTTTLNTVDGNTANDYFNSTHNSGDVFDVGSKIGDDYDMEEQQSLVTQYLLMRSWVSQNTVDELSLLREPAIHHKNSPGRTSSMGSHYTSSMMSNTSSLMRINSSHSPATSSTLTFASSLYDTSRPASLDDYTLHHGRPYIYGRDSANAAPLTSSSTLEDNDDDYDILLSPHPVVVSPQDDGWRDLMYNKENLLGAPLVPPRPISNSPIPIETSYKTVSQRIAQEAIASRRLS